MLVILSFLQIDSDLHADARVCTWEREASCYNMPQYEYFTIIIGRAAKTARADTNMKKTQASIKE